MIKKLLLILFSFCLVTSCKKEEPKKNSKTFYKDVIIQDNTKTITPEEAETYYEYNTENSSHYEYNYLVNGLDQRGDSVSGVINIKGKHGAGSIINIDNEAIDIQVEWIDYGKLKGTDEKGNIYKLEAN